MEIQRKKLRQRWELASILNFFNVFEPVIQSNMKISAEEIETALIEPNDSLAQLHILLLKGVVPSSKLLNVPDAWVSVLSKKLAIWWPWVAEGEFPLTCAKGEEMNRYKEFDPTTRLYILKALCEMRADRDDILAYINDTIKGGTGLSTFQKEKLGEDGRGTSYWYDGNDDIGHRLYKEVQVLEPKLKVKGRVNGLGIISLWETLATNYEEFHKVVNEFSSSKLHLEVAVAKAVEASVIPSLERLEKKKERVLKKQRRQEKLLAAIPKSVITRSCRTRRPVSYRFEEYDKAIQEALQVAEHREIGKEGRVGELKRATKAGHPNDCESIESGDIVEKHQGINVDYNANDEGGNVRPDSDNLNEENEEVDKKRKLNVVLRNLNGWSVRRPNASRCNGRAAGTVDMAVSEGLSFTINTDAEYESAIIPDSEDENSTKDTNKRVRNC